VTTPTAPADGKFVTSDAVVARFAGDFPSNRVTWVKWRILDVENELIRRVPSLATIDVDADPESVDAEEAAVGRRVYSVRTLVIDKVLELYDAALASAKSQGGTSLTSEMDGFRTTIGFGQNRERSSGGSGVTFTEEELNRVRLPKKRKPRFGSIRIHPSGLPC
jgi:hypothetical protein